MSELYQPSNRHPSGKLVPTLADRGGGVVRSARRIPTAVISVFLTRAATVSSK
jgi:hypothetical protein